MSTRWTYGIIAIAGLAMAQFASQAIADDPPISIMENTSMDFGDIIFDGTAGTVTISTAGAVTGPLGYIFGGSPAAGAYSATGQANQAVTISFTNGSLAGPGAAMTLDNFTHNAGTTPSFDGAGDLSFNVGADLSVNAAQTGGSYSGTMTVTVNY